MRYKTKTSVIKEIIRKIVKESYDHDFDLSGTATYLGKKKK